MSLRSSRLNPFPRRMCFFPSACCSASWNVIRWEGTAPAAKALPPSFQTCKGKDSCIPQRHESSHGRQSHQSECCNRHNQLCPAASSGCFFHNGGIACSIIRTSHLVTVGVDRRTDSI